jgi:hypothetical protein
MSGVPEPIPSKVLPLTWANNREDHPVQHGWKIETAFLREVAKLGCRLEATGNFSDVASKE